jgi:hypothetical protein
LLETVISIFALVVTVVALAGLTIFPVFLLHRVSATQADGDRHIYLLSGVEAVVSAIPILRERAPGREIP